METQRFLPDPLMVRNARIESRGKGFWLEGLLFFLIVLISMAVQTVLLLVPETIAILQTPAMQELQAQIQDGTFTSDRFMAALQQIMAQLPDWLQVLSLFATVGYIVAAIFYCKKIEKRRLATMGLTRRRGLSEYLLGLGVGLLLFVLVMGLNLLTGGVRFVGVTFRVEMLPMLLVTFLAWMVQGASEEILCRGYCCISYARRMPLWVGIVMSAVFFALLHLGNSGVTSLALANLFLFGVFMALYMIRRGNLWGVCAIHTIWNFAQGDLFGLQVSGTNAGDSVLSTEAISGAAIWNGGAFGPEGGICVTIVLVAAIAVLLFFCQNRDLGQTPDPIPDEILAALPDGKAA